MSEPPRIFLITPPIVDAASFGPLLRTAMEAADVACVLLRTQGDEGTAKSIIRALAPTIQRRDSALLIEDDARLAARIDADGVHVAAVGPGLEEALDALRARKIVGAGGLKSRDDAMTAGESGVDYLMFGGPDEAKDQDAILERVAWWAEIFNVPCVGYAVTPAHAGSVARAGAEFIAVCDGLWDEPERIAATLAEVEATALRVHEAIA